MGENKRKIKETFRVYEKGELVSETITETEEDIIDEPKFVPISTIQSSSPKCIFCGADMVELNDNTAWWGITPKPKVFQCSNPNCVSNRSYIGDITTTTKSYNTDNFIKGLKENKIL